MHEMSPSPSVQSPHGPWFLLGNERNQSEVAEPPRAFWQNLEHYDAALQRDLIEPLEQAAQQHGRVPRWLQLTVLKHLHWYFTVDARERAPTVVVSGALVATFHERVRQIVRHVDPEVIEALDPKQVSTEVRHALLSYKEPHMCSAVALDAYDHDQGLARLTYYIHGEPPAEVFVMDGAAVTPAYAKYRACNYFSRRLLRQRIVWLPVAGVATLEMKLAGVPVPVALGAQHPSASEILPAARLAYPPGKGGQQPLPPGWTGWKVRLMKMLARMPMIRQKFAKAWVFVDRDDDADDNAEHLYRWVSKPHPEINAWFLLKTESSDWARLKAEGVRLMPPGLMRKLLILNSEHIISSHTDYVFGGFKRALYGDAMQWRYTFLQHGVIKDDLSHWLAPREFDCFITSSPDEHQSIVGDDTAYPYTDREVKRTGLPRHDRLLQIAQRMPAADTNVLLVMPTWRGGLVDERMTALSADERMAAFATSDYARHWRALLRNDELREQAARHDQRIVFMPHPNAVPYIDAFDPPAYVQVVTAANSSIQQVFASTSGFITDYTSVAFEMAFLRRPVFYYQFDRQTFYGGGHNWRLGYFDYDRDGFGPVALTEEQLVSNLKRFFVKGCQPDPQYLARMLHAMPDQDDQACRRVFESALGLRRPIAASTQHAR
jgi:hypothetical protein